MTISSEDEPPTYPVRPGDWLSDEYGRIAKVKTVYDRESGSESDHVDLVIYSDTGERIGRVSPAMGGPTTYEPFCSLAHWHRISKPEFPISVRFVQEDGRKVARKFAGEPLPWRKWRPRKQPVQRQTRMSDTEKFRLALEKIAAGDNNARQLAIETLGLKN